MGKKVDLEDLVGVQEIAARFGLQGAGTVHSWRRRYPEFPEPILALRMGLIWSWDDVIRWAEAAGRTVPRRS